MTVCTRSSGRVRPDVGAARAASSQEIRGRSPALPGNRPAMPGRPPPPPGRTGPAVVTVAVSTACGRWAARAAVLGEVLSAYCLACRGVYDVTRWPGSG